MASLLPSGEKSGPLVFGTSRVALLPSGFAMKADWIPLDGSIRSNAIWPLTPRGLAPAGAASAATASATEARITKVVRSRTDTIDAGILARRRNPVGRRPQRRPPPDLSPRPRTPAQAV